MRRIVVGAIVLMAAGSFLASTSLGRSTSAVRAQRCAVVIYFTVPATAAQIRVVKSRLSRDRRVVAFRFITRAQAFEQLRKRDPAIAANLNSNPLPARLHVQLKDGVDSERVVTRYRALNLRSVEYVRTIKPSRTSCFLA
jgi:cell division protein FtsX